MNQNRLKILCTCSFYAKVIDIKSSKKKEKRNSNSNYNKYGDRNIYAMVK